MASSFPENFPYIQSINGVNITEVIFAAVIEGVRSSSAKRGIALGASNIAGNFISTMSGLLNQQVPYKPSRQNLLYEPVMGAAIFSLVSGLLISKDNFAKNFFVGLIQLEAAAGFAIALSDALGNPV